MTQDPPSVEFEKIDAPTIKKRFRDWPAFWFKFLFLLPALAALLFYMFYPILETFRISLTKTNGLGQETFVGFLNYLKLITDDEFQAGLLHVFQWAFWSVVIQIPLAFFIAYSCTILRASWPKIYGGFIIWATCCRRR